MRVTAQDVVALARQLDSLDYYRLLRVERGARAPEIRSAYHRMRRIFHPDAHVNAAREIREAVDLVARRVTEAYVILRDPARRRTYDRDLEGGALRLSNEQEKAARKESETQHGATPQVRRFYLQAREAEQRGDLKTAISQLKLASGFEPSNEHFKAESERLQLLLKEERTARRKG